MRFFKHLKTYLLPVFLTAIILLASLVLPSTSPVQADGQIDLVGPAGSGKFGASVTVLPNGNVVVTDPGYDAGGVADVGAVYLYNGATRALISVLTGGAAVNDQVGSGGVTVLSNGNYVVRSPDWNGGKGAVTWGNGTTGVSGLVSALNSLVGGAADDQVGSSGVTPLSNGNYVVSSPNWDNGSAINVGAVTWGNGTNGITGVVSSANSLVGSKTNDQVGDSSVTALSNGNYVVSSTKWDGTVGAVTWGNGEIGRTGEVSVYNSLVGGAVGDFVGSGGVTILSNGNYVVSSYYWNYKGAVTWCSGTTGITGVVSTANSLVGSGNMDLVGRVTALSNGNYVVSSNWSNNGEIESAGAVTWANGTTGLTGVVSTTNSLVGSGSFDFVGSGVTALSNGNYVVSSSGWNDGKGAVTWVNGTTGLTGVVSTANSLVGGKTQDQVGSYVTALNNSNYVVSSPGWGNSATANVGAVTWVNGTTGLTGVVSTANSLVGNTTDDFVGNDVIALNNGNYVVSSFKWNNDAIENAGAVTWVNGTTGLVGVVSAANSLVGSKTDDQVGSYVTALSNGNYVVRSYHWDNGSATDAGAVTWGNGATGLIGVVSAANSLVGSTAGDQVGDGGVTALSNGNYVIHSPYWDSTAADAGAVTWGGNIGTITAKNSVRGTAANGGKSLVFAYDELHHQLIVGRPADNIVTFFDCHIYNYLPIVVKPAPTGSLTFRNDSGNPVTVTLNNYETRTFVGVGPHLWSGIPVRIYQWEATGTCNGQPGTVGSTLPTTSPNYRAPITIQANQTATLNAERGGVFSCG